MYNIIFLLKTFLFSAIIFFMLVILYDAVLCFTSFEGAGDRIVLMIAYGISSFICALLCGTHFAKMGLPLGFAAGAINYAIITAITLLVVSGKFLSEDSWKTLLVCVATGVPGGIIGAGAKRNR